jgi:hypothetical protein
VSLFKQVLHCCDLPFFQSATNFFVGKTLISFIHMSVSNIHFFGKGMTKIQGYKFLIQKSTNIVVERV